jgi:hypothetical protein
LFERVSTPVRTGQTKDKSRGEVGRNGSSVLVAKEKGCAEQLARFFPHASAVRVPVQVTSPRGGATNLREATIVEYSSAHHAIFLSTLPLEFGDRIRLEARPQGYQTDATVDAVQYHDGCKAVGVRFLEGACDWVTKRP